MNNWVEGMMKATGGYVTAWDVVNEAISGGGDNGEGFYPLQSASNALSAADLHPDRHGPRIPPSHRPRLFFGNADPNPRRRRAVPEGSIPPPDVPEARTTPALFYL